MASTTARPHRSDSTQKRRGKGQSVVNPSSQATSTTAMSEPSTPLRDRTLLTAANMNSVSTKAESSFLPELGSTPPMPAFANPPTNAKGKENDSPRAITRSDSTSGSRPDSCTLPGISDPGLLLAPIARPTRWMTIKPSVFIERLNETPPLPDGWTQQHDRAICVLDVRNYSLYSIVAKIRRTFPGLRGTLTPGMVDRRLRQLDQDIEIDYWRVGLRGVKDGAASRVDSGVALRGGDAESTVRAVPSASGVKSQSKGHQMDKSEQATSHSRGGNAAVTQKFGMGYRTSHAV